MTAGGYLGPISMVADGEKGGILEALQSDEDMLLILTDSMAAKATAISLARGAAPRSGIERDIKAALQWNISPYRNSLIGGRQGDTWGDLDLPLLVKGEEVNKYKDGAEEFFQVIFTFFH